MTRGTMVVDIFSVLGEKMDSESLFFFMLAKVSEQNRS